VRRSDFAEAELAKELYWRDFKRKHGPAAGIRVAEELRRQVIAQRPEWPTARERAEDHASHQRVLDAFARARARTG
jgi:hypothetical protein